MSITDPPTDNRTIGHGRYTLLHELGRGGAGMVWRGEDQRIQRAVAIKETTFPVSLSPKEREETSNRILREVRTAGNLNHPATVTIFDVLWENNTIYIVMELVEGSSLADVLQRVGPMNTQSAAQIALEILDALQAAHNAGIVHRDIKPSNVMLPASDAPAKLADFGLAWMHEETKITQTDTIVGTPAYLAPEQINGHAITPATDLWQLGVTLYNMLQGTSPFRRDDQQTTLFAILGFTPQRVNCGEPLSSAIAALLDKNPQKRPTAAQLRSVLEQYGSTNRSSERTGTTHQFRSTSRWRRPAQFTGATLAMACAVAGGVVLDRTLLTSDTTTPASPNQAPEVVSWDTINNEVSGPNPSSVDMTEVGFEKTGCTSGPLDMGNAIEEVPCDEPHDVEFFDSYRLPTTVENSYPRNISQVAINYCLSSFESYGNKKWVDEHDTIVTAVTPSERRWGTTSEFRNVLYCAAHPASGEGFTDSDLTASN